MPIPPAPPNNLPLASSLPRISFRRVVSPSASAHALAASSGDAGAAPGHAVAGPSSVPDGASLPLASSGGGGGGGKWALPGPEPLFLAFGFVDPHAPHEWPAAYVRHREMGEQERMRECEYDMDEQDKEWLDALNAERRAQQLDVVAYETFEILIDRLEKEWFALVKRIPVRAPPPVVGEDGEARAENEDVECAICDDGECENSNAIVFCDGCNLAVHQDCYGIPYIPEGQWLCRKCTVSPDRAVCCVLCPHEGGAFKQTTQGRWAHLLCAMWIPETGVSNAVYMEPIDSVERIPKARWKLQCYLCNQRTGACIQCDQKTCFTAFHVTCARKAGLLLKTTRQRAVHHEESDDEEAGGETLKACCHKHMPKDNRSSGAATRRRRSKQRQEGSESSAEESGASPHAPVVRVHGAAAPRSRIKLVRRSGSTGTSRVLLKSSSSSSGQKSARAYKSTYVAGPPLVPWLIITKVLDYIARLPVRKKPELALRVARFWSLKREARRGAPLLKRLHLEPWTASKEGKEQTDTQRIRKLEFLFRLREDLEKIRMLAELVRKREKEKLRQVQLLRDVLVRGVLLPYHAELRRALDKVSSLDRAGLFLHPVARSEVPDYYDIVTSPMTWSGMAEKLEAQQYGDAAAFRADIELVLRNAMLYNKPDTAFHRSAQRILKGCAGVFETLEALEKVHGPDQAGQEQLGLEPEEAILRLLCDYEEQTQDLSDSNDAEAAPKSAIEDLVRHFYSVEAPAAPAPAARAPTPPPRVKLSLQRSSRSARTDEGSTAPAQASSAQSPAPTRRGRSGAAPAEDAAVEELERAPRSEQDKAAARLARAKTEEEKEETRRRKQRSALAASQASAAARQRRKREAEEAAAARSAKKQRASASPQLHGGSKRDAAAAAPDASSQASVRRGRSAHRAESESSSSSAEATSTTPEAERALRQRRSGAAPEPRELEVQQVDSWDSFKRFNVGWVLPEGSSRRGNRAAAAPSAASSAHDAQSARKRSASATTAPRSGERAASSELSEEDAAAPAAGSSSSSSNAPPSHRTASAATASATTAAAAPVRIRKRGSHGQFISKHDDPSKPRAPRGEPGKSPAAVRRARPSGGSEARSNEASSSNRRSLKPSLLSSPLTSDDEDESSSARRTFVLGASDDEELTEPDTPLLHGHGDDEEAPPDAAERAAQGRARRNAQRREKHRLKRMAERRALQEQKERGRAKRRAREEEEDGSGAAKRRKSEVQLDDDDEYAPATLVWAKVSGHPFFPAEVIDAQADDVPDDVLEMRELDVSAATAAAPLRLVRFFDGTQSYAWVPTTSLRMLLEDEALDGKMLRSSSHRTNHQRASVRAAYARAKTMLDA